VTATRMWCTLIGQAGGEGAVCGNYMPTEPGQDPSHLQFTNSEGSWPGPCGNILVTLSDFF
jgi:diaminopimelate epimerase